MSECSMPSYKEVRHIKYTLLDNPSCTILHQCSNNVSYLAKVLMKNIFCRQRNNSFCILHSPFTHQNSELHIQQAQLHTRIHIAPSLHPHTLTTPSLHPCTLNARSLHLRTCNAPSLHPSLPCCTYNSMHTCSPFNPSPPSQARGRAVLELGVSPFNPSHAAGMLSLSRVFLPSTLPTLRACCP